MSLSHWLLSMSGITTRPGRFLFAFGLFILASAWGSSSLAGQELPLKRNLPGSDSISCPEIDLSVRPSAEEKTRASQFGSEANNANILGDYVRAGELLARATELDPLSAELAYRYGRILENLEDWDNAIDQFCRALALDSRGLGIGDAGPRLKVLAKARQPQIPEAAQTEFLNGLLQEDLGQLEGAAARFGAAFQAAPDWPDAIYNRGVINARLGAREEAVADLQQYLALFPNAPDANTVSQRIGQLQFHPPSLISPGTAFSVGLLIPGMGQFYSGRALGGLSVLSLAAGALAAGFLVEEVQVRCVGATPSGGDCPPDRIISQETSKPYMIPSLAVYGAVTILGAIEAYFRIPEGDTSGAGEVIGMELGSARLSGPSITASGTRLNLNLVRVTF
jgi:tetratricopeptide (TPR) repeat protein